MSIRLFTAAAIISLSCSGAGIARQASDSPSSAMSGSPAPEVVQIQANPPGEGPASQVLPNPETASAAVPPAMPADPGYQAGPYKGALTSPPAEAMNKSYPLCTRQLQDRCVNPGEAGVARPRRATRKRG